MEEFEIIDRNALAVPEADAAKQHWANIDVDYYKKEREWSRFMAQRVLSFAPNSVFEFGCNAGKNLVTLRRELPNLKLHGIDINSKAIAHARQQGLAVACGDEHVLELLPDQAFDVCFTVSVLDHLSEPETAVLDLARISGKAMLLLEPWLGKEGKVVRNKDRVSGEMIDTTPFSYSWDYLGMLNRLLPRWTISAEAYPMESNLGRYYTLYSALCPDKGKTQFAISNRTTGETTAIMPTIQLVEFATLKNRIPRPIYTGLNAFINKKVNVAQRNWTKRIENIRNELKDSDRALQGIAPKGGYVVGEKVAFHPTQTQLGKVVRRAAKRPIWCRLLYTLADKFAPKNALELGTCVGISTAYQAAALQKKSGKLFTLEGSSDFSKVAEENLTELGISNVVEFVRGLFDHTLSSTLDESEEWDFIFIDGHHDGDATWRYLREIQPRLAATALVIFDDIRWSDDMLRVWEEIVASGTFQLCIDFEELGVCAKFPSDQHYRVDIGVKTLTAQS